MIDYNQRSMRPTGPPPATRALLNPGVTWFGWRVPTALELAFVAVAGIAMLGAAIVEFQKVD